MIYMMIYYIMFTIRDDVDLSIDLGHERVPGVTQTLLGDAQFTHQFLICLVSWIFGFEEMQEVRRHSGLIRQT